MKCCESGSTRERSAAVKFDARAIDVQKLSLLRSPGAEGLSIRIRRAPKLILPRYCIINTYLLTTMHVD